MIHRDFREPNFLCSVQDNSGRAQDWLACAASEDDLRARIDEQRREVDTVEPYDFNQWKERAVTATRKIISAQEHDEPLTFNQRLWAQIRNHLLDIFDDKCAYCETKLGAATRGNIDHYRPKGAVSEEKDNGHHGYYWLAYSSDNLLPSCPCCNQDCKKDHFPIGGRRAFGPDDLLEEEEPLLLNPFKDNPQEHLAFTPAIVSPKGELTFIGTVADISPRGKHTIDVLQLNRGSLLTAREERMSKLWQDFAWALGHPGEANDTDIGTCEYSAALQAQCKAIEQAVRIRLRKALGLDEATSAAGEPATTDE